MRSACVLGSLVLVACSSSGSGGGSGGGTTAHASSGSTHASSTAGTGGGPGAPTFQPAGCAFSIQARPEYQGFGPGKPVVGSSPQIVRVRLGLGGNVQPGGAGHADPATSIAFAWQTDDGTLASDVAWGDAPDPTTWPAQNRASGVTWVTPPAVTGQPDERMHEAYVCGLTPATTYYYRVGGGPAGAETWSDVLSFTTTPAAGATPIKIGIMGDSRGEVNDAWHIAQQRMHLASPTLQLFSGDAINLAIDQNEWEKWLDVAWKDTNGYLTLGQTLTLATHGNHENHTSLFFGNLVLPQEPAKYPSFAELFYSVDVGPVHLVVLDDFWIGDPSQMPGYKPDITSWLEADLTAAEANRANVPFIVTMHHHGAFSSSTHGGDADVLAIRSFLVPIWDAHHVDLDVTGHDHNYERSLALTGPADTPTFTAAGTTYVICAGVGADAYGSGTSAFTATSHDFSSDGGIGVYAFLSATPTTPGHGTLTFEAHELRADATDPVIDTFTLTR